MKRIAIVPQSFTRLQNKLFEIGPGTKKAPFKDIFIRHHFRNGVFRKLSLNSRDLILTSDKFHSQYSSYSEAEIIVIIEGFEKMMNMKGSGIDGAITRGDVVDIFRGNEWVINEENGWFKDLKLFESELKEFNKRREYLNSEGSDEFIEKFYKSAYNRFYLNFPHEDSRSVANGDGFYSMVEPHPWLGDLKMFIDIDLIGYARIDITNEYWDFFLR